MSGSKTDKMPGSKTDKMPVSKTGRISDSIDEDDDGYDCVIDNDNYEYCDDSRMFRVSIIPTECASRLNLSGSYVLVIDPTKLALVHCSTRKVILHWPYRFIKRFGVKDDVFQFEAGRRSLSGPGDFVFYGSDSRQTEAIHKAFSSQIENIMHPKK